MKIFIAYKQSGRDKSVLRGNLERISKELEQQGHKTFIFMRDIQKWQKPTESPESIIRKAFKEITKVDIVLCWIDTKGISSGLSLEVGYSQAKGKKLFVLIRENEEIFLNYSYIAGLADYVVKYKNKKELFDKFPKIPKGL